MRRNIENLIIAIKILSEIFTVNLVKSLVTNIFAKVKILSIIAIKRSEIVVNYVLTLNRLVKIFQ